MLMVLVKIMLLFPFIISSKAEQEQQHFQRYASNYNNAHWNSWSSQRQGNQYTANGANYGYYQQYQPNGYYHNGRDYRKRTYRKSDSYDSDSDSYDSGDAYRQRKLERQIEDLQERLSVLESECVKNLTFELRMAGVEGVLEAVIPQLAATDSLANANAYAIRNVEQKFENLGPSKPEFDFTYGNNESNVKDLNTWDQCPFCTDWWVNKIFFVKQVVTTSGNLVLTVESTDNRKPGNLPQCQSGNILRPPSSGRRRGMQSTDSITCTACYRLEMTKYGLRGKGGDENYDDDLNWIIPFWNPNDISNRDQLGTRNGNCPNEYFGDGGYNIYDYNEYVSFVENGTAISKGPDWACNYGGKQTGYFSIENWKTCGEAVLPGAYSAQP